MKKIIRLLNKILGTVVAVQFFVPSEVYAYIDPGSGSYFTQIILGMFLGMSFFWKSIFGRIKSLFAKKDNKTKKVNNDNNQTKKTS